MLSLGPLSASLPDLLRLLSVPVFGWAAYRDVRTRRVRNRTWYPLLALATVLFAWDAWVAWSASGPFAAADWRAFALPAAVSVGIVVPLAYVFWRVGGFGGADAKALVVLALLFPAFPTYEVAEWTLPAVRPPLETFSFTVLTNTVAFGVAYPLALAVRNAVRGRFSLGMFVGHEVAVADLPERHGRLLDGPGGSTGGLDLDALRMYLRWRGTTLAALRERPDWHRDPASVPGATNDPTDGAVSVDVPPPNGLPTDDDGVGLPLDAGPAPDEDGESHGAAADQGSGDDTVPGDDSVPADAPTVDHWGAAAFLDDIEGTAYGTTPGDVVRAGVDGLVAAGLSAGVAERVYDAAGDLPAITVDWGAFPEAITRGENDMREVTVRNAGGGAQAGVRVTVNGVEMTTTSGYLDGERTVPVGVFGARDELEFVVEVAFPDLPLVPVTDSRTVQVE